MSAVATGSSTNFADASKRKAAKEAPSHPTYSAMILKALSELKEKSGSSKPAILRFMMSCYKLRDNFTKINSHLHIAPKKAVVKGELKQVKASGASGSFRLGEKKSVSAAKKHDKKPGAKKHNSFKATAKNTKAEKQPRSEKKTKAPKANTAKKTVSTAAKPKARKPKVSGSKTKNVKV